MCPKDILTVVTSGLKSLGVLNQRMLDEEGTSNKGKGKKKKKIEATAYEKKTMGIVEPLPSKNHSRTIEKVRTVKSLGNFYIIGS